MTQRLKGHLEKLGHCSDGQQETIEGIQGESDQNCQVTWAAVWRMDCKGTKGMAPVILERGDGGLRQGRWIDWMCNTVQKEEES